MTKRENYKTLVDPAAVKNVIKREDDVIVFPRWSELGLLGCIFAQVIRTKENQDGQKYDENLSRPVLRILGGKVLINGLPDAYSWPNEKFEKEQKKGHITSIGCKTTEGLMNLHALMSTVRNDEERKLVAELFCILGKELDYVHVPPEARRAVCVTRSMLDRCSYCINEWTDDDVHCGLCEGDWLIVNEKAETLYRVGKEEFGLTYDVMSQ